MDLLIAALGQGALYAPMALGVYLAFRILNTPDLTIDGSFVFGMTVCAAVTVAGHPYLALAAGIAAGAAAGSVTGFLQTKLRINPILSGILTMTGLYTINYMVLGGRPTCTCSGWWRTSRESKFPPPAPPCTSSWPSARPGRSRTWY
jgi:putative ABC transport system permease protein